MEAQPTDTLVHPDSNDTAVISNSAAPGPFVDTLELTLATKVRITLPASIRPAFADGGLLVMWKGPCIALLTAAGFDDWIAHLRNVIPAAGYDEPGGHIRYAHAQASRFKPDVQGRFILADRLRFAAAIDRDITVVGAGSRVELWNPATYGADLGEFRQNLEFHQDEFDLLGGGAL